MSDVCFLSYRNYNLTVPYYGTMNAHQNAQTKIKKRGDQIWSDGLGMAISTIARFELDFCWTS